MNPDDDPWAAPASFEQGEPSAVPTAPAARRLAEEPDPWASPSRSRDLALGDHEPGNGRGGSTCYLLHFDRPYGPGGGANGRGTAQHYSGTTTDLAARLAEHEKGQGARLLQVVKEAGITWRLARTWPGGRDRERQLKNQGGASRRCPECGVTPRTGTGAAKQATARSQGEAHEGLQAQDLARSSGHLRPGPGRDQLAAGSRHLAARPTDAITSSERQPRERNGPQLADMEAEP